ncbi:MAG: adenosylcobinamide-GDP ribazoletransferase [Nocardioides sp.]|nr:adenosylcobinamide-GDP ribazoletransferase [Nocardioides sp.]
MTPGALSSGWRLAVGTLTAIPVRPPALVDRHAATWAVRLAPVAALALAVPAALLAWAMTVTMGTPALVGALVLVGAVAWGTRGLHLDGLSDTADGLASSFDRHRSLEVMKTGVAGPAGVATTVLVLGLQVAGAASVLQRPHGAWLVAAAVCVSRLGLAVCCVDGVEAARPDGLGRLFTSTQPRRAVVLLGAVGGLVVAAGAELTGLDWWRGLLAVAAGGLVVVLLVRRASRRFGGVTGDVFGAAIEIALAAMLVLLA